MDRGCPAAALSPHPYHLKSVQVLSLKAQTVELVESASSARRAIADAEAARSVAEEAKADAEVRAACAAVREELARHDAEIAEYRAVLAERGSVHAAQLLSEKSSEMASAIASASTKLEWEKRSSEEFRAAAEASRGQAETLQLELIAANVRFSYRIASYRAPVLLVFGPLRAFSLVEPSSEAMPFPAVGRSARRWPSQQRSSCARLLTTRWPPRRRLKIRTGSCELR